MYTGWDSGGERESDGALALSKGAGSEVARRDADGSMRAFCAAGGKRGSAWALVKGEGEELWVLAMDEGGEERC